MTSTKIAESGTASPPRTRHRRGVAGLLGLAPFTVYAALFLALPTFLAVWTGLWDGKGNFTWDNFAGLAEPSVLNAFWSSIWLALLTAAIGAVVGALVCYALLGIRATSPIRVTVDAAASVLAQFGGVMLAFVFMAAMGTESIFNKALTGIGIDIYADSMWLFDMQGLIMPYLYFQLPLMVITFMPAMRALKPQWAEANLSLGGTRRTFWTRIGMPVLAPSFAASYLLLFANAFSAYATAAALMSQGSKIVPLQIRRALTSETVLGRQNLAGALAAGMIVVMVVVMVAYSAIQRRAERWRA